MLVNTLWTSVQARLPSSLLGGVQRSGEPPLVRPQLPLLGDSIRFGRDAGAFLNAHRREHGDVFTVLIAGHRMTFMLDPLSIPLFLRQAGALRFREMADQMGGRAFGYTQRILEQSDQDDVYKLFNEHLKGEALPVLSARLAATVALHVAAATKEPGGCDVGLYALVKRCMFAAGTQTLFGDSVLAPDSQADFELFDRAFSLLMAGVPAALLPGVKRAQQRLALRLQDIGPTASALVRARQVYYHGRGDRHDQARVMLALFWATQANTFPAAFWALSYLLSDPKALAAVRAEIEQAGPDLGEASLDRMVCLDSAIKETLRLCTAPSC